MISFTLEGDPIAQCRPRLGKGVVFDPLSATKKRMKWEVASKIKNLGDYRSYKGPLAVEMYIYSKIADSSSKSLKMRLMGAWSIHKPDVDNFAKFYLDLMTGILYEDDKQVSKLLIEKRKSDRPRVEIKIYPLESP
jgi:Holliday junction resolvase RusA-like endonuclease